MRSEQNTTPSDPPPTPRQVSSFPPGLIAIAAALFVLGRITYGGLVRGHDTNAGLLALVGLAGVLIATFEYFRLRRQNRQLRNELDYERWLGRQRRR